MPEKTYRTDKTFLMNDNIRPPEWATHSSHRLDMQGFGRAFGDCWRSARTGMLKVEAWQTYQEPGTRSLRAFKNGDYREVRDLVSEEARLDDFVYDDVRDKGRHFTRFRLVELPLSEYLEWEFWNYRIREELGEVVLVIDKTDSTDELPSRSYFDFLLFDGDAALIHDYGTDGLQVGGWLATSDDVLDRLGRTIASLRQESVALERFISAHHLRLPGEGQVCPAAACHAKPPRAVRVTH
jgi:hypothetical protein